MENKIIAISGLSGSGKTTIANILSKELFNGERVVTTTTRPIRPGEENGKDYIFVNNEIFLDKLIKNEIILPEVFDVASGEKWFYGLYKSELEKSKHPVIVLTPQGISDLKKLGFDVVVFYIHVDEDIRLERITSRKDNQGDKEIKRRNAADKLKFKKFKYDYIVENLVLDDCIKDIEKILKEINLI